MRIYHRPVLTRDHWSTKGRRTRNDGVAVEIAVLVGVGLDVTVGVAVDVMVGVLVGAVNLVVSSVADTGAV